MHGHNGQYFSLITLTAMFLSYSIISRDTHALPVISVSAYYCIACDFVSRQMKTYLLTYFLTNLPNFRYLTDLLFCWTVFEN